MGEVAGAGVPGVGGVEVAEVRDAGAGTEMFAARPPPRVAGEGNSLNFDLGVQA